MREGVFGPTAIRPDQAESERRANMRCDRVLGADRERNYAIDRPMPLQLLSDRGNNLTLVVGAGAHTVQQHANAERGRDERSEEVPTADSFKPTGRHQTIQVMSAGGTLVERDVVGVAPQRRHRGHRNREDASRLQHSVCQAEQTRRRRQILNDVEEADDRRATRQQREVLERAARTVATARQANAQASLSSGPTATTSRPAATSRAIAPMPQIVPMQPIERFDDGASGILEPVPATFSKHAKTGACEVEVDVLPDNVHAVRLFGSHESSRPRRTMRSTSRDRRVHTSLRSARSEGNRGAFAPHTAGRTGRVPIARLFVGAHKWTKHV
jgi:hypothetical protein